MHVTRLLDAAPKGSAVYQAIQVALDGTPEEEREFLDFGHALAVARDEELLSVRALAQQAQQAQQAQWARRQAAEQTQAARDASALAVKLADAAARVADLAGGAAQATQRAVASSRAAAAVSSRAAGQAARAASLASRDAGKARHGHPDDGAAGQGARRVRAGVDRGGPRARRGDQARRTRMDRAGRVRAHASAVRARRPQPRRETGGTSARNCPGRRYRRARCADPDDRLHGIRAQRRFQRRA